MIPDLVMDEVEFTGAGLGSDFARHTRGAVTGWWTAGFVNQDIGVVSDLQDIGTGLSIAAVGEDFAIVLIGDAHADGGDEVDDGEGMDGEVFVFEEEGIVVQADAGEGDREEVGPVFPAIHIHCRFDAIDAVGNAVEADGVFAPHLPHVHQHIGYTGDMIGVEVCQDNVLQLIVINAEKFEFVQGIGAGVDEDWGVFFTN